VPVQKVLSNNEIKNRVITGEVFDEEGNTLSDITISIKGTRTATLTGNDGIFRLVVKTGFTLIASGTGFEPSEAIVNERKTISISLKKLKADYNEVVVVAGMVIPRRVKKDAFVPLIPERPREHNQEKVFEIYPNPLSSGENFSIEWKGKKEGYYAFEVLNQSGQSVHQQQLWIDAEARLLTIDLPSLAAGNYFVVMINKKSRRKYSEKLIIQ